MKKTVCIFITLAILSLTHCTHQSATNSASDYTEADIGKKHKVVSGVILSERTVKVCNRPASKEKSPETTEATCNPGYEYVIRLDKGSIISVVQTENLHFKPKQHILVIYGSCIHVVSEEGVIDE